MQNHFFKRLCAASLLMSAAAHAELSVSDAWVRAVPPVSKTSAAYFTLTNSGEEAVTLVGASADFAGSAELHDMSMHEGKRSMRHIDALPLAPGDSVTFGSGGLHVMLFGLVRVPAMGEQVTLCLQFAEHAPVCDAFDVRTE